MNEKERVEGPKCKGEKQTNLTAKKAQKDTHLGKVIEKLTVLGSMLGLCVAR